MRSSIDAVSTTTDDELHWDTLSSVTESIRHSNRLTASLEEFFELALVLARFAVLSVPIIAVAPDCAMLGDF